MIVEIQNIQLTYWLTNIRKECNNHHLRPYQLPPLAIQVVRNTIEMLVQNNYNPSHNYEMYRWGFFKYFFSNSNSNSKV